MRALTNGNISNGSAWDTAPCNLNHNAAHEQKSMRATLDLLACPVCFELMSVPIFQCKEGHTICSQCKGQLKSCPSCRSPDIDIRCRVLETMSESIDEVHCKYRPYGCRATLKYPAKKDHELKCSFRPLECLHAPKCRFHGIPSKLVSHLLSEHGYVQHGTNKIAFTCTADNMCKCCDDENEDYFWRKIIYSCYDKHFALRVHRAVGKSDCDAQFYIAIVVLHSRHHSNRYSISTFGNHRKYSFEGPVWSVTKGFGKVERVRDCLILPENMALFLSGGKGSETDLSLINLNMEGEIMPL
eukprot:GHVL01002783.1.p1 GENE.GHVL01002783.1~~GHVL01002783.1.p1  ORF type:complete len:299 (+),score=9.37 GHVL01002783.1:2199-3095(+)